METILYPEKEQWPFLLTRPALSTKALDATVQTILDDVRSNGDDAIKKYTAQFDKTILTSFQVTQDEFEAAEQLCDPGLKQAIQQARGNIEKFHAAQKDAGMQYTTTSEGVTCWRKSVAIERVGLYIPGGSAPLFSTLLMLGVPAKLAGCKEIIVCTPSSNGKVNPAILYTANLLGIRKLFKVGGVQAIGAMAYGTETISGVYKIFGPGNQYVTCAKQLVSRDGIAIDMPAGPSELTVLADDTCVPAFVAADLLSQAEHGPDSQVLLVALHEEIITAVKQEIEKQLSLLPRREMAAAALQNSRAFLVHDLQEGLALVNAYAPEHLIIACKNDEEVAAGVINAGSVFLGNYSPESAGDYASGTNHVLPTNGFAKAFSGVSVDSFVRKITFQKISRQGIAGIGKTVQLMAAAEGLEAHRNAVTIRLQNIEDLIKNDNNGI